MSSLVLSKEDVAALQAALPALHRIAEQLNDAAATAAEPATAPTPAQSRVSRAATAAAAATAASRVSVMSMGSRASSLPPLTPDESALERGELDGGSFAPTKPPGPAPTASRVSMARGAPSSSASRVSQARNLGIAQ
jgi:hypothetical protein